MVLKKKKAVRAEKKQNLEDERQMNAMAGPWGKPGPGGAVWRNPRDIGLNFNKSMGWTDNEIFTKLKGDERRNKRSSLALPDVKRDNGSRQGSPNKENVKPTAVDKLPNINQTPSPKEMSPQYKRHSVDVKLRQEANVDICKEDKRSPNRNKFVKRLSNGERVRRIVSDDSYDEDGEIVVPVVKTPTPETAILHVTGGVELVPLLARRRRVGARTLHSSDVTRPPDQSCQWREMINMEYLRDLKHQMRVKCIQKEEKRLNSAESVRRHHETWESLWGRQGHGAPLRGKYARHNLAHLLYSPMANAH